jgi:hypothetical protein
MTYQPTLSPHDGTPMDQCPVNKGDRVQITDPTQDMIIYQGISKGVVGEVLWDPDNTGNRPHHMSHGWYIWLRVDQFSNKLVLWDPARMRIHEPLYRLKQEGTKTTLVPVSPGGPSFILDPNTMIPSMLVTRNYVRSLPSQEEMQPSQPHTIIESFPVDRRRARLQEIISGIIGGDYIKAGCLDRDQIIKDLEDAFILPSAQA